MLISKQSRDASIEIHKLYVVFSLSVKTEEIRSFWPDFRKTLSLTEQNFYFVQLINLSFRGQITDWFGLLRRIYVVIYYYAVLAQSLSVFYLSFTSHIFRRLISAIYDLKTAGCAAVNPTQLSRIWSSPMHDFRIFKLVCQKSRLDICVL